MKLSSFGIEWNRNFSTQNICVRTRQVVKYLHKKKLIETSSEHLLFGNTKRFCIKVCFFSGGFLVVAVVVSLWNQARNMAGFFKFFFELL